MTDPRVLMERDDATGIARITFNDPERKNCYDPPMRAQVGEYLDELAMDDHVKVVVLRGEGGVFSTGADMGNAYGWYGSSNGDGRTAAARAGGRASVDDSQSIGRRSASTASSWASRRRPLPKCAVTRSAAVWSSRSWPTSRSSGATRRSACPRRASSGPALGSLHMFFHRLGPVLARRLLLTGDTVPASTLEHLGVFTEVVDDADVEARANWFAQKVAKMPADGIVMAKEAFRLVEQLQAYQGEEVASYLFHAFGTNLQFENDEFNFVKARAEHGTKGAFELRDAHFDVPEPQ